MTDKLPEKRSRAETDDTARLSRLHGSDRSGLGSKGWAQVPADRIGGHPELKVTPQSGPDGGLNGPQPEMDPATGAARTESETP